MSRSYEGGFNLIRFISNMKMLNKFKAKSFTRRLLRYTKVVETPITPYWQ